jgi:hypothetical protein
MTNDELKKARAFYHSLTGLEAILESAKVTITETPFAEVLSAELTRIKQEFPSLLPPLDLRSHLSSNGRYYQTQGLRSVLAIALSRLKVAIEATDNTPVTSRKDFPFVKDPAIRSIVERDFLEIQRAYVSGCWKSVIILAGGVIEAILLDQLQQHVSPAMKSQKAPKGKEISDWGFVHLILVSVDLKLVQPGLDKLSHSIREYRDLVHPAVEVRSSLQVNREEATIAIEILIMLHRELSNPFYGS